MPTTSASFGVSTETDIVFSDGVGATVGAIEFAAGASAYTFSLGSTPSPGLTINGAGIVNASSVTQRIAIAATSAGHTDPQLLFSNTACAGGDNVCYSVGPDAVANYGGGVVSFTQQATAGTAMFTVRTGVNAPPAHSTVGAEVSFSDTSSAASASFTIYGSLGTDGDTFGNVVFHDQASAAQATFTNVGGTVAKGDGGNTQFYGSSTASLAVFNNYGGSHAQANGGDVAFDATATGGNGIFNNYAAPVAGAYGGVTSFNNNPPHTTPAGASAGQGHYINFGARPGELGGGGHVEFSARYGSPTADTATIVNYGSAIADKSSAGHTLFSISLPCDYFPTAGSATVVNHPAPSESGAAGYTEFAVFGTGTAGAQVPTAGTAVLRNIGATSAGAKGGYTVFSGPVSAGSATLIALAGSGGGQGGRIAFYDASAGESAQVLLIGNGELDVSYHKGPLSLAALTATGGLISMTLGTDLATLNVAKALSLIEGPLQFAFSRDTESFSPNTTYTLICGAGVATCVAAQFSGNAVGGVSPTFEVVGDTLQVVFTA